MRIDLCDLVLQEHVLLSDKTELKLWFSASSFESLILFQHALEITDKTAQFNRTLAHVEQHFRQRLVVSSLVVKSDARKRLITPC